MKLSIWKNGSGKWHSACTDELGKKSGNNYYLARALGISPGQFILYIVNNFNYDSFHYNKDYSLFYFVFKTEAQAKSYANTLNKKLREKGIF